MFKSSNENCPVTSWKLVADENGGELPAETAYILKIDRSKRLAIKLETGNSGKFIAFIQASTASKQTQYRGINIKLQ